MSEPNWKSIALYLADCHAATAAHEGTLKSVPKSRKERYANICLKAIRLINGHETTRDSFAAERQVEAILERLNSAALAVTEAKE